MIYYSFFVISYYLSGGILYRFRRPDAQKIDLQHTLYTVTSNLLISAPVVILLDLISNSVNKYYVNIYLQLPVLFLSTELWFDLSHRLMHTKYLYRFHKKHHKFIIPYSWASLYCHPLEMIVCNVGSNIWTTVFVDYNMYILILWNIIIAVNTNIAHTIDGPHAIHHKKSKFNMGVLRLLDRLLGTSKDSY